ncbi:unnamed protein product [Trichobilharzia szidati]|nr:unnamed protein product [Trichobilharzia szidati]
MSKLASLFFRGSRLAFSNARTAGSRLLASHKQCNAINYCAIATRTYSSQIDRKFNQVLTDEIKQEKENSFTCNPPTGFQIAKREGCEFVLRKEYSDGVCVDIEINLAGSVSPGAAEDDGVTSSDRKPEEDIPLEARPDLRIKLTKPSGRAVIFNCSLPSREVEQQLATEEENNLPTYSVDSVEMERIPGYFVYTDLFDDNMYEHTMQLLMERGLNADFQQELQDFCTSEEHKLYLSFLDEFQAYCKE